MSSNIEKLTTKGSELAQKGEGVLECGKQIHEEAKKANEAFHITPIDETETSIQESALGEAKGLSEQLAQNDIESPNQEISAGFEQITNEAKSYEETERTNIQKVEKAEGAFSQIASSASGSLESQRSAYESVGNTAEQQKSETSNALKSIADAIRNAVN